MAGRKRKNQGQGQAQAQGRVTRSTSRRVTRSTSGRVTRSTPNPRLLDGSELTRSNNKKRKGKAKVKEEPAEEVEETESGEGSHSGKTIVIEHWKGKAFKTRADEFKDGLEKGVPGITVLLNPKKKPRKGCFEVRGEGGQKFLSLLKMKPPFNRLLAVDVEKEISDIIDALRVHPTESV